MMIMRCEVLTGVIALMIIRVKYGEQLGDDCVIPRVSNGP